MTPAGFVVGLILLAKLLPKPIDSGLAWPYNWAMVNNNDPRRRLIAELASRYDLSVTELARRLGRSVPTVWAWFNSDDLPDHESIRRIVKEFPDLLPYAIDVVMTREDTVA